MNILCRLFGHPAKVDQEFTQTKTALVMEWIFVSCKRCGNTIYDYRRIPPKPRPPRPSPAIDPSKRVTR